jgi:hypothetical protein
MISGGNAKTAERDAQETTSVKVPMIPLFWLLRTPASRRLAEEDPDTQYETIICPADAGHQRPGRRTGSLSVITNPSALRDFTWTWLSDTLISQKVVDLFKKHRVTGFEVVPVKTSYPKRIKASPPDLFELVVTG